MNNNFIYKPWLGLTISIIILTFLYFPIFYTNYAYLDEAHQLWNNQDSSNYDMFFVQGRWLSGICFKLLFSSIHLIADLKITRIISFFSWVLFLKEFFRIGEKWQRLIGFQPLLLNLSGVYIACAVSIVIYIGWGACFEVGIATLFGLWSGNLFFEQIIHYRRWRNMSKVSVGLGIVAGLCSLFMYQISFGFFLIPFVLYLIHKKTTASFKILLPGIIAYFIITIIYYGAFLISLKVAGVPASNRTNFSFDIVGKLGFFFGIPLSHAFSFNFLYNSHSVLSQAFPIVMMAFWVVSFFKKDKNILRKKLVFLILFIALCMLIYLPLLVSKESFSSYRTMFALNFVVAFALLETVFQMIKTNSTKNTFAIIITGCFVMVAYRNFRFNFIKPLNKEYHLVKDFFDKKYLPGVDTVYFLRPPENIFYTLYGVTSFNDEFGIASTFKDWTPVPLLKQLIFEKTNHREIAEKIIFIQFSDRKSFEENIKNNSSGAMVFDMPFILTTTTINYQ